MAGVGLRVLYDGTLALAHLEGITTRLQSPQAFWADVGEYLLRSHDERWRQEIDPLGHPWQELSEDYAERKADTHPGRGILVLEQYLQLLAYQVTPDSLTLGTARVYGATHQFGRPEANIPARPYLGLSDEDTAMILSILAEHLQPAGSGAD